MVSTSSQGFSTRQRQRTHVHRTSSRSTPDAVTATPFPHTLTTTVFSQCSCGRFRTSPRRAVLEGQTTSITRTAPPSVGLPSPKIDPTSCVRVHNPGSRRSAREPLGSYGSCRPAVRAGSSASARTARVLLRRSRVAMLASVGRCVPVACTSSLPSASDGCRCVGRAGSPRSCSRRCNT